VATAISMENVISMAQGTVISIDTDISTATNSTATEIPIAMR
jgi:hypothetical protein